MDVLVQEAQLHAARADDVAAIRCFIAPHETEDRALTGAVAADESGVFAGIHL
jgi:hypothetical protein